MAAGNQTFRHFFSNLRCFVLQRREGPDTSVRISLQHLGGAFPRSSHHALQTTHKSRVVCLLPTPPRQTQKLFRQKWKLFSHCECNFLSSKAAASGRGPVVVDSDPSLEPLLKVKHYQIKRILRQQATFARIVPKWQPEC